MAFSKNSWKELISLSKWLVRPWCGRPILLFWKRLPLESQGLVTRPFRRSRRYCGDSILSTQTYKPLRPLVGNSRQLSFKGLILIFRRVSPSFSYMSLLRVQLRTGRIKVLLLLLLLLEVFDATIWNYVFLFLFTDDYLISASYDTTIKVNIERQLAFVAQFVILIVIVVVSLLWSRVTGP